MKSPLQRRILQQNQFFIRQTTFGDADCPGFALTTGAQAGLFVVRRGVRMNRAHGLADKGGDGGFSLQKSDDFRILVVTHQAVGADFPLTG